MAGDSFGELALIAGKNGTRAARIVAADYCQFGVLSAGDYNKSLAKVEMRRRNSIIDYFIEMP